MNSKKRLQAAQWPVEDIGTTESEELHLDMVFGIRPRQVTVADAFDLCGTAS